MEASMYQTIRNTGIIFLAVVLLTLPVTSAFSLNIGYYDTSREVWGFDGNDYMTGAKQWLVDAGYTLTNTAYVDSTFLGGVDAFFTGLIDSVDMAEVSAMQNFVDTQGGFLFIQTDWAVGSWTNAANDILSNWEISVGGDYSNDAHVTVGTSDWVTSPNTVTTFTGAEHSVVTAAPDDFEVLGMDDLGRTVLGVFDAGAGRSSDVLISTDINFFADDSGWTNLNNRNLWENIWTAAATQIDDDDAAPVPEPSTWILMGTGLVGLAIYRRRK